MQYRKFGRLNLEISALGFGCMRFPVIGNDNGKIDENEAIRMVRYAIDNGVNYIDTAYPYHQGSSEPLVAKALKDGYREKIKLATKLPVWLVKTYDDFDKYLNEQLERLETEYIDFYLLHALNRKTWENSKKLGVLDFIDKALKDGRIKHIGFSFHDDLELFKEIVDSYDWTFCQIQFNYMDEKYQAGIDGMKYAAAKDLAVIIMEPLKGGKLAKKPRGEIKEVWDEYGIDKTSANLALRWVWSHPEVTLLLSGMSTMEQVEQNIKSAEDAFPLSLTNKEIKLVDELKNIYRQRNKVGCTGCEYCMPCPNNIVIPDIFEIYNEYYIYDSVKEGHDFYNRIMNAKKDASLCIECAKCETACPQNLAIINYLKEAHEVLSKENK